MKIENLFWGIATAGLSLAFYLLGQTINPEAERAKQLIQNEAIAKGHAEWKLHVGRTVSSAFVWLPREDRTITHVYTKPCDRLHVEPTLPYMPTIPLPTNILFWNPPHVVTNYVSTNTLPVYGDIPITTLLLTNYTFPNNTNVVQLLR